MIPYFKQPVVYGVYKDEYSFGIEIEFFASENYRVLSNFDRVLGIDGACLSRLGEYRSPVFHSRYSFTAFRDCIDFTREVFSSLYEENLIAALCPNYKNIGSMGIHFSVGGKFIDRSKSICDKSSFVQSQLKYRCLDYENFRRRENGWYGGEFTSGHSPIRVKYCSDDWDYYQLPDRFISEPRSCREYVIEYRFFPSCNPESIFPYLFYILFDDTILPSNPIVPYYNEQAYQKSKN